MNSRSFFTWLLVGNMILITVILSLGSIFIFRSIEHQATGESKVFHQELLRAQQDYVQKIWAEVPADHPELLTERIQTFCRAFNNQHNRCRITVVDTEGHVLGDSEELPAQMALHNTPDRPEILDALKGDDGEHVRQSSTRLISYRYQAVPIMKENTVVGAVRLATPLSDIREMRDTLFRGILLNSVFTFFIALALSVIFAWYWFRPLQTLRMVSKNISQGDLQTPVIFHGPRELEFLASALEHMRKTVSRQMEMIENQRVILQTIFDDLDEAIFAIDSEDHLLYLNTSARRILEIPQLNPPVHLWTAIRHGTILSVYEQMKNTQTAVTGQMELEVNHRRLMLEVMASPVFQKSGKTEIASLLILRDQTLWVQMNQMKSDFVANASHELRTPLTTIRAAIDNLRDGVADDPQMVTHLVNILDRHVGRLEAMVQDLLDLHIVENENISNHITTVRGEEIVGWLKDLFTVKAAEKDVKIQIKCEIKQFQTDEIRLHLILQNIVDNAIKFSPSGNTVNIHMWQEGNTLHLSCQDNGCGIPREEQAKIFNRFYQANTAKSGDNRIRGTGLGMAIVKHALERLRGIIEVDSFPGKGTTIKIQIPCTVKNLVSDLDSKPDSVPDKE
ncbi:MAG: ATP-binding protein [Planctomycetia bacterium]|nr:ATP-binding protein [Planctomycetia bacterium]